MQERKVTSMKKLSLCLLSFILLACSNIVIEPNVKEPIKEPVNDPTELQPETSVHFVGVGDNLIHQTIYEDADRLNGEIGDGLYDFEVMYEDVKEDVKQADLAFINQETILGGDALGLSGYPTFNSPEILATQLTNFGFNMINHATNHSLDKYETGVLNCINNWRNQKGIVMSGIFDSQEDRDTIRVIEKKGIRFAFLAYTYGTNGISPYADYAVAYLDPDKIKSDVEKAKAISDVIIVSAHWGNENQFEASSYQKDYARLFADLGVDVVIGTHPHVIQPVEWLKGTEGNNTLVVYSLGNFIGGMLGMYNNLSGMISFDFVKQTDSGKITIESVKWNPLISHYQGDANNILEVRSGYKVIKLKNYTDELAAQHGLNGVDGQTITRQGFIDKTNEVIQEIEIDR